MPTVLLLDTSLSMIKPVSLGDGTEITVLQVAVNAINYLLDHLSTNVKLEFVALITFSSTYDILASFTRDLDSIKTKLKKVEEHDKTGLDVGLAAVSNLVLSEWGSSTACDVILFTDGGTATMQLRNAQYPVPLPFPFPAKLHVICLTEAQSLGPTFFHRLVEMAGPTPGLVLSPEHPLTLRSVQGMIQKLCHSCFAPHLSMLRCGNLTARVSIFPSPQPYTRETDLESITYTISDKIEVFGFIDIFDLGSPMTVSRHLLIPQSEVAHKKDSEDVTEEEQDDGKIPSFCVLMHGALKLENMAAMCTVADNWFGVLYSWADSKKKSNLMLSIFAPGPDAVPWLGDLNSLGTLEEYPPSAVLPMSEAPSFPVKLSEKRSYSQNNMVWVRQAGLQSDIQKILRHARRLPEKTAQFYKELNRVRRAAISFGFVELLETMAFIFDRECNILPNSVHPECSAQLAHVASCLRRPFSRDINIPITPLKTKYTSDHDSFTS